MLLVNVSFMVALDPEPLGGAIFVTVTRLHAKVVPAVAEVPV